MYYKASLDYGGISTFNILVKAYDIEEALDIAVNWFETNGYNYDCLENVEVKDFDVSLLEEYDANRIFNVDYVVDKEKSFSPLSNVLDEGIEK